MLKHSVEDAAIILKLRISGVTGAAIRIRGPLLPMICQRSWCPLQTPKAKFQINLFNNVAKILQILPNIGCYIWRLYEDVNLHS